MRGHYAGCVRVTMGGVGVTMRGVGCEGSL